MATDPADVLRLLSTTGPQPQQRQRALIAERCTAGLAPKRIAWEVELDIALQEAFALLDAACCSDPSVFAEVAKLVASGVPPKAAVERALAELAEREAANDDPPEEKRRLGDSETRPKF